MFDQNISFNLVTFVGICAIIYIIYLLYSYPNKFGIDRIVMYIGLISCLILFGGKYNTGIRTVILSFLIFASVKFFENVD